MTSGDAERAAGAQESGGRRGRAGARDGRRSGVRQARVPGRADRAERGAARRIRPGAGEQRHHRDRAPGGCAGPRRADRRSRRSAARARADRRARIQPRSASADHLGRRDRCRCRERAVRAVRAGRGHRRQPRAPRHGGTRSRIAAADHRGVIAGARAFPGQRGAGDGGPAELGARTAHRARSEGGPRRGGHDRHRSHRRERAEVGEHYFGLYESPERAEEIIGDVAAFESLVTSNAAPRP